MVTMIVPDSAANKSLTNEGANRRGERQSNQQKSLMMTNAHSLSEPPPAWKAPPWIQTRTGRDELGVAPSGMKTLRYLQVCCGLWIDETHYFMY